MKLSIVIVNYNVKYFLAQCLNSVKLSIEKLPYNVEVFVVDNHSVDGSVDFIKECFPWVKLIENKENLGFSKANNQAIRQATGEYILLLNPDTVIEQDTLIKVIEYMDSCPEVGGLGVRMIDGKGNFLPESKRGLPTPRVAFFKITGLSRLFPKSKFFNQYHLGFLDEHQIHEVDILSGAFMLLRKKVLDEIGLLDETFFMYGEDIDLSYRIIKAGYKNVYFPYTTIIHYKGESTKKGSINYVRMFYSAMALFAKKHFEKNQSKWYSTFIKFAIWFRASLALIKRVVLKFIAPFIDFICFLLLFILITQIWEKIKFEGEATYPQEFIFYILPIYALFFVFSLYYTGFYSSKPQWIDLYKGLGLGSLLILSFYALLSEDLRYSRAVVLLGIASSFLIFPLFRFLLSYIKIFHIGQPKKKNAVVIASDDEFNRVNELLAKTKFYDNLLWVTINKPQKNAIGTLVDMEEIIKIHKIDEIIFCSKDLSPKAIIEQMTRLSQWQVDFKIVGDAVIGSKTVYSEELASNVLINSIAKPINKRNKRLFDLFASFLLLLLSPFLIFFMKNKFSFLKNILLVFLGKLTFIGYATPVRKDLPKIKNSVLPVTFSEDEQRINEINLMYAKDYKLSFELFYLIKNITRLDRKVKI